MNIAESPEGLEVIAIYSHIGYQVALDSDFDYARQALDMYN